MCVCSAKLPSVGTKLSRLSADLGTSDGGGGLFGFTKWMW
jgi:hypothetical protein